MKPLNVILACALALIPAAASSQTPDARLAAVLAQMDTASQQFKNARADFSQDYYEAIVRETTNQSGTIYFERKGSATQMGAVIVDPKRGKQKVLEFKDGLLRMFDVPNDQIRLIKSGSNQATIETFLTLGFGGSGKDLARAWNVTYGGSETLIDGGQSIKTEKLELVSKDPGVRNTFSRVTIWVDPTRGISLKQVFETPSHDRRTSTYSHFKLNAKIDASSFEIKKGPHTTTVGP